MPDAVKEVAAVNSAIHIDIRAEGVWAAIRRPPHGRVESRDNQLRLAWRRDRPCPRREFPWS